MKNLKKKKAFTLVEVMVSMAIFSIVMAALPIAFVSHLRYNTRTEEKTGAIQAAQKVLDEFRVQDPSTLPENGSRTPVAIVLNGKTYQAISTFCKDPTYCTSINNRHIEVEVKLNNVSLYKVETVFTRLR